MANERRVYANLVGGLVEDNPLAAAATTLTSAGLAALPAIGATEHAVIVFDPDGLTGAPFAKRITAHTAAATTATIEAAELTSAGLGPAREVERDTPWVHALVAGDLPIVAYKAADESVTASTALQNDDHLAFPVDTAGLWVVRASLRVVSTSNTPDVKLALSVPAGATGWHGLIGPASGATATEGDAHNQSHATLSSAIVAGVIASGTADGLVEYRAFVEMGGTAGTVNLQWAQNTSDAAAVTIKKGSWLEARRVA